MSDKSSIGDRMKRYEAVSNFKLTPRMPLICRLDGKAFHSYTKGFNRPFDEHIKNAMTQAAKGLVDNIQGAKLVYIQSDELSVLVNDYENFETKPWFGKKLQKIVSVSASVATAYFNKYMIDEGVVTSKLAMFDSRAFVIPQEETCNYFYWRQIDAERNSVSSLAQAHFSHKSLHQKKCKDMKKMLLEKNIDWDQLPTTQKRGWCVLAGGLSDFEIPRFQENREYIDLFLKQIEE